VEHFPYRPEPGSANRPGTHNRHFDDRYRQVYRAPSQAGSGNDIHTGSPGLRKAPTWAPRYSGSSGPVPGDNVLQVVDVRAAIVGHDNFAIARDLLRLPAHAEARFTRSVPLSKTAANCAFLPHIETVVYFRTAGFFRGADFLRGPLSAD